MKLTLLAIALMQIGFRAPMFAHRMTLMSPRVFFGVIPSLFATQRKLP